MCHRHAILEPQTPSADSRGAQNKRQNKNRKTNKNTKLFPPPLLGYGGNVCEQSVLNQVYDAVSPKYRCSIKMLHHR